MILGEGMNFKKYNTVDHSGYAIEDAILCDWIIVKCCNVYQVFISQTREFMRMYTR